MANGKQQLDLNQLERGGMALSGEISRMKYLAFDAIWFDAVRYDSLSFFYTHSLDTCVYTFIYGWDCSFSPREGAQLVANNKQITNRGKLYQKKGVKSLYNLIYSPFLVDRDNDYPARPLLRPSPHPKPSWFQSWSAKVANLAKNSETCCR